VAHVTPAPPAPTPAATPQAAVPHLDPVQHRIASADRHFDEGRYQLRVGHLSRAKTEFNRALEVLLETPQGLQSDVRLQRHFDWLVDRIAALELSALANGDGFTEQAAEPASIDELLAIMGLDTTPPTLATAQNVEADLQQIAHDIPIPLNERVLRYVELFQGRLRDFLTSGLQRGAQYLPMIQSVFRAEGLPLDLAYVPLIESAFKPTALSRAKAKGVWQFMHGTALENGLKHDWYVDERSDPAKSTVAAAKYFKALHRMFGDWHLAMASYNGGPGRVQRAVRASGRSDFWSLTATSRYLPQETREYVPMILAAVIIAKNPLKYGFDIVPTPGPAAETVEVPPAVDLRRVAEWAGVSVDEIQKLNPELRRWTTPIRGSGYALAVPEGSGAIVQARLGTSNPRQLNALQWYSVKSGETLTTIARKLKVNRTDLAEANYLSVASRVSVGQKLLVPQMPSAALLARAAAGLSSGASVAAADADDDEDDSARVIHRVKPGETLYAIARRYQTTVEHLRDWNNLRTSTLQVGARLIIQVGRAVTAQQQQN
jgi:membrane-bound lytic murein transglycosylase D